MSTPASSCSFTASTVASRLARTSSEPSDFQGAHSVLGSASHSGLGSEPAIVVGNSMSAYPPRFLDWRRLSATSAGGGTEQRGSSCPALCRASTSFLPKCSQDVDGRDEARP